jgi:steroid delta-isomerase-like uncharacterized protein
MSNQQSLVNRYFTEMCTARKLDAAGEIFAANHTYHDPSSPWVGPGPEGMKQLLSVYHKAFPDSHWTVDEMLSSGDTVVTRWTGRGTHRGELAGLAPTGRAVQVTGIWIHRVANGRIVESWNSWDTLGMMQQVGAVPATGTARGAS